MRIKIILIGMSLVLSLTSCMSYDFSRRVVQQGNLLSATKVARLRIGMSKDEVAILMGHSLLSPVFNDNRWDYAYTLRKANNPLLIKNLSLYFTHDRLVRIEHRP